ncbi:MAG TPA: AAA family ATPase [Gaiellales bacterium]|nr:AAA family ATPase [Gaiellales bacterium]
MDRVLCATLVGRERELFELEDALLAAHRGSGRMVALGGEAGMGKTRLASELAKRARRLDWEVLSGACSEAELPLPYLPIVEAIGNHLARQDVAQLAVSLGAARRELAQLFPQLADDGEVAPVGDPGQAKLRLFEAVVALLGLAARDHGLLLIVEDIHWADAATRELLDHLARRIGGMRAMVLVTYRSDELDRRHPLAPVVQAWRRSGLVDTVQVTALDEDQLAEMVAAILDEADVSLEFRHIMHQRTEGNPFVLEEMLREAIDRGDIFRTADGWDRRADLRIPETVRDTIILRFERLGRAEARVLEAAAVLGRTFDYSTLVAVADAAEEDVREALAVGVRQQLLDELDPGRALYQWRHAMTQEAVADEVVLPRRQEIHSRAADAAERAGGTALERARHLLGAGRFDEAVPLCVEAAEGMEATLAFSEALRLLEHALPYTHDELQRSRLLCRMGRALWMEDRTGQALEVLSSGIAGLERMGEELEAAAFRIVLGRCAWEQGRSVEALEQTLLAVEVLERGGPSAELSHAYMRLAGHYKFEFDPRAVETAMRALEVARGAGADFERVWATSWLGFALLDEGEFEDGWRLMDESFDEARRRGYSFIAHNIAYNEAWTRLHMVTAGVSARLDALAAEPGPRVITDMIAVANSWVLRIAGRLPEALAEAESAVEAAPKEKTRWRSTVELAEVFMELGRVDEAAARLPLPEARTELQDIVYDAAPQIRVRLATGRVDEAVALAREIAEHAAQLAAYGDSIALAAEALVTAGLVDEAQAMVDTAGGHPAALGSVPLDEARGRILLARGDAVGAAELLDSVAAAAGERGFRLAEWRAGILAAEAVARAGDRQAAERRLDLIAGLAADSAAGLIVASAKAAARSAGVVVPEPDVASAHRDGEPEFVTAGERMVTVLFADVRGYTRMASATAPADLADRVAALHRWAAAEIGRRNGLVDKFAGDAVMATFNATGSSVDHTRDAVEAALALAGKAALLDLGVGIGVAVGPAVVGRTVSGANISVLGSTTNLAARLQAKAGAGELLLSEEAYTRVHGWLGERQLATAPEVLELKGYDQAQPAIRLRAAADPVQAG